MSVRRARPNDVDRILFIINSTNEDYFRDIIPPEHFIKPILEEQRLKNQLREMKFIVMEQDGEVIGVAASVDTEPGTMEMHWLYVLSQYQRLGVGLKLVSRIEEEARLNNMRKIRVATLSEATWAIEFYTSLGYVIKGKRPNPWGHDTILEKRLDGPLIKRILY